MPIKLLQQLAFYFLLILTCLYTTKVYFTERFPYTHDGENHLIRFANYETAIREGQIPPRFAPNLVNHYGYPVFNYNYPLANILSLPFSIANIHYELTFKLLVIIFVFVCAISIHRISLNLCQNKLTSFFSILVYLASPYLTNLIYFRGNIGEIVAFCLLPTVILTVVWMQEKSYLQSYSFFMSLLIWSFFLLSHNITTVFAVPLLILIGILFLKKPQYKHFIITFILSIFLTLWFWLPALTEKSYVVLDSSTNNLSYQEHFPKLTQLLFSPLQFGFSYPGSIDTLSFSLGLPILYILLISSLYIYNLFKNDHTLDFKVIVFFLLAICLIVTQLSITSTIWEVFPLLSFIQFPWRLSIFLPLIIVFLLNLICRKYTLTAFVMLAITIIIQLASMYSLRAVDYFHRDPIDYEMNSQSTSTQNENMPKNFTFTEIANWQPTPIILEGKSNITVQKWRGSYRTYDLLVEEKSLIVEPTMNFLGWETTANSKKVEYLDSNIIQGRIAYILQPGTYHISTKFTENTLPRIIGDTVFVFSFVGIFFYLLYILKQKYGQ